MTNLWITGGTGFLGAHIAERFVENGDSVTVLKRTSSALGKLENVKNKINFIDISCDDIRGRMCAAPPDMIIHCATDYGRDINCARSDIVEANLLLPLRLLEMSIEFGVKVFINTDTFLDKGISAYSLSKNHFRDWLMASSSQIVCVNIVLEHFYGPGDDPSKFVTFIVKSLLDEVSEIPLTAGMQRRDFIHIDDVVSAFAKIKTATENYMPGFYEFEIGTGTTISIRDFVGLVKDLAGNTTTELRFNAIPYRTNEIMNAEVDLTRILELGWHPTVELRQGIVSMIYEEKQR